MSRTKRKIEFSIQTKRIFFRTFDSDLVLLSEITDDLFGCVVQPHRVHCEQPFSKLANTSLLQVGHFRLTTINGIRRSDFINQPSGSTICQKCALDGLEKDQLPIT